MLPASARGKGGRIDGDSNYCMESYNMPPAKKRRIDEVVVGAAAAKHVQVACVCKRLACRHEHPILEQWYYGSPVVYRADLAPNGKSNRTGGVLFVGNAMGGNALSEEDQATGEHGVCTCRTYVCTQQYLALV